ncbi:hypothetical protein QEZ52_00365 [Aliisedimentitalea scapharcae]|uniref:Minor tail protein n=1 Tax=Aliisedimentitalea scapharcae TaxID=1524259 RepID=A0ABZ2XSY6_9RHOB
MAYLNDSVLDNGLAWIQTNGTRIDICSQEPTTYTEATSTHTLGNDTVSVVAPADYAPDGRKVTVSAVSEASVTATGDASHWAITDGSSVLIATGSLSATLGVTSGNQFNLAAFDIVIRDAA